MKHLKEIYKALKERYNIKLEAILNDRSRQEQLNTFDELKSR